MLSEIRDAKYLKSYQKKLHCQLEKCGKNFTLTITSDKLNMSDDKQVYTGKCSVCFRAIKLKEKELLNFRRVMGEPKVVVIKSTFDDLFE